MAKNKINGCACYGNNSIHSCFCTTHFQNTKKPKKQKCPTCNAPGFKTDLTDNSYACKKCGTYWAN